MNEKISKLIEIGLAVFLVSTLSACAVKRQLTPVSPPQVNDPIDVKAESFSGTVFTEDPRRSTLIYTAYQMIGFPYKVGGEDPIEGFDCSGLMQYSYKAAGIDIPRTVVQQIDATYEVFENELKPGDLAFYKTGSHSHHVGIYIGNGDFLHASTGKGKVRMQRIDNPYWQTHLIRYGRVPI